jgi:hypothetical protein
MGNKIKFSEKYDVVVAGGGVAGVAAALSSARYGAKTALIEKTVFPGGLATSGNVFYYLPLSDAFGRQVTFGIAEELLLASIKYGPGEIPENWNTPKSGKRYASRFSPASFILAMDEILENSGVDIWYDTLLCGSVVKNKRMKAVKIENKSGRGIIEASCFVDASGDADMAFYAGAECAVKKNFLSIWLLGASMREAENSIKSGTGSGLLHEIILGGDDRGGGHPEGIKKFSGVSGKDVTEFIIKSRELVRTYYKNMQAALGENGRKNEFPLTLPSMADFRATRRIEGQHVMKTGQFSAHFPDCAGLAADWRGGFQIWEMPYRSLLPRKIKGLLAAGRCISAKGQALEVMRVIPAAAMSGEVAGLAAAMSAKNNTTPDRLRITEVQNNLKGRGFLLDIRELGITGAS